MDDNAKAFIDKFLTELREDNVAVFVGAGMSRAAGFVDWSGLLRDVAKELKLDSSKESDLVSLAQFHVNANRGNRHHLNQLLIDQFSDLPEPSENHKILARLPIRTYWTTNYDRLIEKSLEAAGKRVDAKYTKEQLATTRRGRDAVVYKMHGDIEHPDKAVLTKDDYEKYHLTHGAFVTALSGQLVDTTFLFLGFSFTDPNLDYILSRIRTTFYQHQRQHYCITKRRVRSKGERKADADYAIQRQAHAVEDLKRFNVNTIFVDDYPEITSILTAIESRFRRNTVFISGSAAEYGSWKREPTEAFLAELARTLISSKFKINSGFGLGIGGAVVNGAVQQIYSSKNLSIEDQLMLRPFPLGIKDPAERQKTFERYRDELIARAGIAVFVMGNKISDGVIIKSDGVRAEFETAKKRGLYLIPIGASGYMAQDLYDEVMANVKATFPNKTKEITDLLKQLGGTVKDPKTLTKPIMKLITLLSKE